MNKQRIDMACQGLTYKKGGLNDSQIIYLLGPGHNKLSRTELQSLLYLKNAISELPSLNSKLIDCPEPLS
jgi:hypothetical protein